MSKEFNKAVRSQFDAALVARAPQFVAAKPVREFAWPGERSYAWHASQNHWCWVSLIPSTKGYNEFFIELGWSSLGRNPQLCSRPCIAGTEKASKVFHLPEFMCNLASVAATPAYWSAPAQIPVGVSEAERMYAESLAAVAKLAKEEAVVAALPLVAEAVEAFVRLGVPFLQEYVAQQSAQADHPVSGGAAA